MYGHFNLVLRDFILERQGGEHVWQQIVARAQCETEFNDSYIYDEEVSDKIIALSIDILGLPREPLLEMLGEYYLTYLQKLGFGEILRNLGHNVLEFLQNLDSLHALCKREYPDMTAPSFRCDADSSTDRMVLHYYSRRKGLHPIVKGLTVEASKAFFNMQIQMDVLKIENEEVANENGAREHVTFQVNAKKIKEQVVQEGPPTFIAQTKKHGEKQILKEDVEEVKQKLAQLKAQLGENALPLPLRKKSVRAKWRIAAKITSLHRGFVPNYPETVSINPRMFIEIFPYHVIFDTEMKVVQAGIKIQMLTPNIRSRQASMTDYFQIRYPNGVDLTYHNLERFILSPFVLELRREHMDKAWLDRPSLQLKGQMFQLRDSGYFTYVASPVLHTWSELENRGLKLSDIPLWDVTRDFLVADLEYRKCLEMNVRQSLTASTGARRQSVYNRRGSQGDVRETICRLQKELDHVRRQNTVLYRAFLPKDAIDLFASGMTPVGEFYEEASALFCDVVNFLPLVASCPPSDVISLLNALQMGFDKVTRVHGTDRVESIGDAYLVVAGVGDKRDLHAVRIANTSLAMRLVAMDTVSPLTGTPILVRFGIHTGSIVTGVLGNRVPRFVVMGETSVIATKLESSGEPGQIHTSPTTYRMLEGKGFAFEERGQIELRGFGFLETYFLIRNDLVSDEDLIGRPAGGPDDVTYVNEGKSLHPGKSRRASFSSDVVPFQYSQVI